MRATDSFVRLCRNRARRNQSSTSPSERGQAAHRGLCSCLALLGREMELHTQNGIQWIFLLAQASGVRTMHSTWRFRAETRLSQFVHEHVWPLPGSHDSGRKRFDLADSLLVLMWSQTVPCTIRQQFRETSRICQPPGCICNYGWMCRGLASSGRYGRIRQTPPEKAKGTAG